MYIYIYIYIFNHIYLFISILCYSRRQPSQETKAPKAILVRSTCWQTHAFRSVLASIHSLCNKGDWRACMDLYIQWYCPFVGCDIDCVKWSGCSKSNFCMQAAQIWEVNSRDIVQKQSTNGPRCSSCWYQRLIEGSLWYDPALCPSWSWSHFLKFDALCPNGMGVRASFWDRCTRRPCKGTGIK